MLPIFHADTNSATNIETEKGMNASVPGGDAGTSAEMGTYMLRRANYFSSRNSATEMPDRSASNSIKNGHR